MRIISMLFVALLGGCGMPPETAEEFRNSKYPPLTFKVDLSVTEVFQLLIDEYAQCYQVNHSTLLPIGDAFISSDESKTVEVSQLSDHHYQIAVRREVNLNSWYERMIELQGNNEVQTEITVYQLPVYNSKNKTTIELFLSGDKVSICEN
ncbi:hypothetical protein [Agarivorans aestuarii]|uniref:hypothetical protein n=1 Tax=Agarivorans aestuarii TaxID=1563703 RepID=UPI001C80B318|nr:hypothetical protein [Agarivorans aestuarii]